MANNIGVTEGADRTIATDEVAGANFQVVKLADGTEDSTARIPGTTANGLLVDVSRIQGTPAVSVASLPLPSGAATAANQTTANTSLSDLDTNLGAKADTSASSDSGTFSLIALIKRLLGKIPGLGQATMANSLPVVLPSDQTVPVALSGGTVTIQNATLSFVPALSRVTYSLTRPANTTKYAAYHVLADSTTAATQPSITGSSTAAGAGLIRGLTVWMTSQVQPHNLRLRLYFYSTAPAAQNDNALFSIPGTLPDFHIDLPPFVPSSAGTSRPVSYLPNLNVPYLTDASGLLYFTPVVLADKTPISADTFWFVFLLNRS